VKGKRPAGSAVDRLGACPTRDGDGRRGARRARGWRGGRRGSGRLRPFDMLRVNSKAPEAPRATEATRGLGAGAEVGEEGFVAGAVFGGAGELSAEEFGLPVGVEEAAVGVVAEGFAG